MTAIDMTDAGIPALDERADAHGSGPVAWTTALALECSKSFLSFEVCASNIWGARGVPLYRGDHYVDANKLVGDVHALQDAALEAAKTIEDQAARIDVLRSALEIATDYMCDYIGEQRVRYAGYKPNRHACWDQDEAQVRAALKGGE